jgi:hypothetical protein
MHQHPYGTRSKRLRETKMIDLIEFSSRSSSDSSVEYLGSFHKSPLLVTLEDSEDSSGDKVVPPNE